MRIINHTYYPEIINLRPQITSCGRGVVLPKNTPSFQLHTWSFMLFNYNGRIQLQNDIFEHHPGYAFFTAPHVFKHHFPAEESFHFFVQMDFPEQTVDYKKSYFFIDTEDKFPEFSRALHEIMIFQQSDKLRAELKLWDMLQMLKDGADPCSIPQPLCRALEYIEIHLHQTIEITELAEYSGVSQSYLTRLFHKHHGKTITGYIRKRRLELAHAMLINSDRPVKEIAAEVGITDLHYFNKCVKHEYNAPPRTLRERRY